MQYFKNSKNKTKEIIVALLIITSALVLAKLILSEAYRYIFILMVVPTFALISKKYWTSKNIVKMLIVSSFFPVPINISTTNLGATSQYIILGVFGLYFAGYLIGHLKINFTKNIFILLCLLFIAGAMSTVGTLGHHNIFRTSFWSLIMLITCGSFLLLIDSLSFGSTEEKKIYFTQLMDLIIFLTCIQIISGAIVYYFPQTSVYSNIFYSKNTTRFLSSTITDNNILRLRTIVFTVESLGEFIAVIIPYVLFRITEKFSPVYIGYMLILCAGLMLSATRSGILLTIFSIIIYLFFIETAIRKKLYVILATMIVLSVVFYFDFGVSATSERLLTAYNKYEIGASSLSVVNRSFFKENIIFLFKTISLFGNGLVSPLMYGILSIDFHNLFMTILFRYGVIGFFIYFSVPTLLIKKLLDQYKLHYHEKIYKVLLLSIVIFFINECKFEYTRQSSGVLIIWILFSVYFLFAKKGNA